MTDFWDWAVAAYGRDGVAEACLALQDDHDQCVPLLLWAAWRANREEEISAPEAVKAAGIAHAWSDEVVAPLRRVRRRLKVPLEGGDESVRLALREKIKVIELEAERTLMSRLAGVSSQKTNAKQDVEVALVTIAAAWAANVPKDGLATLAEALIKA